ncbi:hypothetical protein GGX14DRAFT_657543 [Mycena pura]|uniref:Yeast cell wall synthesis Kre9/Knh1-like N-terminal domain-containing protein n=1 Tax=Mycena pura TaxID=153505 RepID=A0AAD7E0W0_9AGAR|nr:hypothetical protein GGX14DRAFT_657543 [Mycena pura]
MHFSTILATLLALDVVHAALFFIQPANGSTCTGGSPCTISWQDDGVAPRLSAIDVVNAGLYHGKQQLVQAIPPVDVSTNLSTLFTPNPKAGANSDLYYIAFVSTTAKVNGTNYVGFSPFFTLNGMSGSFSAPLASATSTIAIPTTFTHHGGSLIPTTITVGSVDPSLLSSATPSAASSGKPETSSSPVSSRFSTSSLSSSSSTDAASASSSVAIPPAASTTSSSAAARRLPSLPVLAVLSLCALSY